MQVTITHREGKYGAFGFGKRVHFVEARIDFNPDEMEIVRAEGIGKYTFITGGDDNEEYLVKDFMGRFMTARFTHFVDAQAYENEFRENLQHLKTLIEASSIPADRSDTFEL